MHIQQKLHHSVIDEHFIPAYILYMYLVIGTVPADVIVLQVFIVNSFEWFYLDTACLIVL